MKFLDRNFKEIFTAQLVSIIGGLIAGTLIGVYKDELLLIPGLLIILPGFLELRGNVSGSMASRISSGLFLKVINPRKIKTHIIKGNVIASFLLAIIVSFTLGILGLTFTYLIFHKLAWNLILIPVIAGIIANLIEVPITLLATFYLFKKGHDPNNIMGPFVTSTGDITSVLALLIAVMII